MTDNTPLEPDLFLPTDARCGICGKWMGVELPSDWTALIREDGSAEPIHASCAPVKAENLEWRHGTFKIHANGEEGRW